LVFVAFEGFQLVTNVVLETEAPDRNVPRGVYGSIVITSVIYVVIALVAVGTLSAAEIERAGEYSLALVARPVLGQAGVALIGIAALLSTSSAINATVFGASRMMWQMATRRSMPRTFSFRSRRDVPWAAVVALTTLAALLTVLGGLEVITAFSSLTFLIVSIGVSVANLRMHKDTGSWRSVIVLGILLMVSTIVALVTYLLLNDVATLASIGALYAGIISVELVFRWRSNGAGPGIL
jgi:amino acid transporter